MTAITLTDAHLGAELVARVRAKYTEEQK